MIRRVTTFYLRSWALLIWSGLCILAGGFFAIGIVRGYLAAKGLL